MITRVFTPTNDGRVISCPHVRDIKCGSTIDNIVGVTKCGSSKQVLM